ncbi:MAG: DUF167 domain-containing protein [Nitrospirota bacterium]
MTRETKQPKNNGESFITVSVRVQPRSSRNEIITDQEKLKIKLTSAPVDGAANEALIKFLSDILSLAKSKIEIVSGQASREKIIRLHGITGEQFKSILNNIRK